MKKKYSAYEKAIFCLSRQMYSEKKLIDKLNSYAEYSYDEILETINKCKLYDYINDEKNVNQLADNLFFVRKKSIKYIEQYLYKQKYNLNLIQNIVLMYKNNNKEQEENSAMLLVNKKFKNGINLENVNKVKNFLLYRGFSYNIIVKILQKQN